MGCWLLATAGRVCQTSGPVRKPAVTGIDESNPSVVFASFSPINGELPQLGPVAPRSFSPLPGPWLARAEEIRDHLVFTDVVNGRSLKLLDWQAL